MAAPHVSGAVALYAAANPGATAARSGGDPGRGPGRPDRVGAGKVATGGRLDVRRRAAAARPAPPPRRA
jgi:hypothetical protein